jgi:hypothetical protein
MLSYQRDWYKQLSIMQQLAEFKQLNKSSFILIKDEAAELNAKNRVPLFYEYAGMFKEVFKNENRIIVTSMADTAGITRFLSHPEYKMNRMPTRDSTLIIIRLNSSVALTTTFWQMAKRYFDENNYSNFINGIVRLRIINYNSYAKGNNIY